MTHAAVTRNLGRSRSWRKATVRSLSQALLKYERITTTLAKAKEAQGITEQLIRLGKVGTLSCRRQANRLLGDPDLVARLFSEIAPRFSSREGGYTRLLRLGHRSGDGARLAVLELVELAPKPKVKPKPKEKAKEPPPKVEPPPKPLAPSAGKPPPKVVEKPKPEKPKAPERPRGFLQGLRSFFKKDRPTP